MKAASSLAVGAGATSVARRAALEAAESLGDEPELAVAFGSGHYWFEAEELAAALGSVLGGVPLVGCLAEGVVGGRREVEDDPAVSVFLASGFGGPVETFAVEYLGTASGGLFAGHRFEPGGGGYLLFADPFTFPVEQLLEHLNTNVHGALLAGGVASGGISHESSVLFLGGRVVRQGAVGARLGDAGVDLLVAQGCRPVGNPYTVTKAEGQIVLEMGGRPAYERLEQLVAALPEEERKLLADGGLQFGVAMDEYREHLGQADFLVRGVLGADAGKGSVLVAGEVEVGRTVQFLARDPAAASQAMAETLERELAALSDKAPAGVLLFPCNGRGSRLFSEPDHDAALVAKILGEVPVAGFFAAGELAPVGGRNFLHAFSASLVVLR
jgi:small ligand-binding sensory domain FIST